MNSLQFTRLAELQAEMDKCESAGDVPGWTKATRRKIAFTPPGYEPKIAVKYPFLCKLKMSLNPDDLGTELSVEDAGVMFQRIPITVKG